MRRRPAFRWPSPTALLPILLALAVLSAAPGLVGTAAALLPHLLED